MTGPIERLLTGLSAADIRYIVVGGVAVVLHGYLRTTADLDLMIDMSVANLDKAVDFFEREGFRPRAPVTLRSLGDPEERRRWIEEKNLQVFSLWHPDIPGFEVDIFVDQPLPFEAAYERSSEAVIGTASLRVASIDDLISMKRQSGRPRDMEDITALQELKKANEHGQR